MSHNVGAHANARVCVFSDEKFLTTPGLLNGASGYGVKEKELWVAHDDRKKRTKYWASMVPHQFMSFQRISLLPS